MDDRTQIFSDFQNFTGIDDAGRCFTILEQFNWSLQDAVQSTLNNLDSSLTSDLDFFNPQLPTSLPATNLPEVSTPVNHTPPLVPTPTDLPPPPQSFSSSVDKPSSDASLSEAMPVESLFPCKMLNMNVEYRNVSNSLVVRDTESVGHLKELLAEVFKLSLSHIHLHGWVHKNDNLIRDTDLLRNLDLPKDNHLYILTPKLPVAPSNHSNGNKDEGLFRVTVKYLDDNKEVSLTFPPDKTIKQLKQDVGYCLSLPVRFQHWVNLPSEVKFSNKTTLVESGLSRSAVLELTSTEQQTQQPSDHGQPLNSDAASDSEQGDMDAFVDDDLEEDHSFRSAFKPLMPPNTSDQLAGTESFCQEFVSRYGDIHPIFYIGSLDNAVKDSLNCKARDRKMLAMYLHHDSSVFTNVFCSQVLCAESLISFLSTHFICWPWDLSSPSNLPTFLQTCSSHFGSVAASSISQRLDPPDHLPVILVIARHRGSNEVIELIEGNSNLSETISRLIHATEINTTQLENEIAEEAEREARDKVLAEQDAAYQASLAVDRAKEDTRRRVVEEQEKMEKQQEKQKQANIAKKLQEDEQKQALQQQLADSLPPEPASNAQSVISIKVRCPNGKTLSRRFHRHERLSDLLNFIASQGHHAHSFKLLTAYPRTDLTQKEPSRTFDDLGLANQEAMTLEEL